MIAIAALFAISISGTAYAQDTNSITVTCARNAQDMCDSTWIQGRRLDSVELPWTVEVSRGEKVQMIAADGGQFELGFVPGEHQIILYPDADNYFDSSGTWTSANVEVLTPLPPGEFTIPFQWRHPCTSAGFGIPRDPGSVPQYAAMPGPGHHVVQAGFSTDSDPSGPGADDDHLAEGACPEALQVQFVEETRLPVGLELLAEKGWPVNDPTKVKVIRQALAGSAGVTVTWIAGSEPPPPAPLAPDPIVSKQETGTHEGRPAVFSVTKYPDGREEREFLYFVPQDGAPGRPGSDAGAGLRPSLMLTGGGFDGFDWLTLEGGLHVAWTPTADSNWMLLGVVHGGGGFSGEQKRGTYGWQAGLGYWLTANRRLGLTLGIQNQDVVNQQVEFVLKQVGGDLGLFYDLDIGKAGEIRFGGDFMFGRSMYEDPADDRFAPAARLHVGWALPFNGL